MTPDRYEQVAALFQKASELSPEARERFLAQACAAKDGLRQEVEAMLTADGLARSSLENTPNDLAAALLSAHNDLPAGTVLGDFKILSRLGAGGMGVVYLAEDMQLGRKAALKLLPGDFAGNTGWLARFEQEARLVSGLNHPNIVTVYRISQEGLIHFLATEFVEGRTLREEMASGPMDARSAVGVVAQVATALSAAHTAGIIHRDVKPENIMLRPDGLIKVLDFGLAKSFRDESAFGVTPEGSRLRSEGVVLGTVRYMSPEQARGAPLDPLTDLFSLGVVLYEMVAGRPPFGGETVSDEIAAILRSEPSPLPIDGRDERSELDRIVRKALQKSKADRYQSAEDLATDLTKLKRRVDLHLICPHCGKQLLERKAFCTSCGLPIGAARCRKCGAMTKGRKFCTSCGEPLQP